MPDGTSETTGEVSVSGGAAKWLEARAAESNLDPDAFLMRLVAAFRTVEESGEVSFATESDLDSVSEEVEALSGDVDSLEDDLDALRRETEADVEDVRERVVQVAEALDETADASHDHPELTERMDTAAETVKHLRAETRAVSEEVEDLREWATEGFENYEDVLEYLTETTEDLDEKVGTLARVLVDVRRSTRALAAAEEERAAAGALKHMANEQGVREGVCEECENAVDIALLTDATCPFCQSTFSGVESSRRFGLFQSATLTTGERPALEAPDVEDSLDDELEELVDE
ncbi:hypothetical protein [Salarchaeum japonicum]|uniref:CopG family transcriptional regulator n=1 Tax=Salarchaeum japonicum TaxID=555573 RepID=A0AAV3SYA1_9EURY|nr:hypothetical protein [Salarchaeum japonicum]